MASSSASARCPQNKSQKENVGVLKLQELNKVSESPSVQPYIAQSSKRGAENKDPNESAKPSNGVDKLTGVSRLPVLKKSLQSAVRDKSPYPAHKKWEERPLLGKAQKRKPCTKPVPFNLSQPRIRTQKGTEVSFEPPTEPGNRLTQLTHRTPAKTLSVSQHRTKSVAATPNSALGENYTEHANNALINSVSLTTEIHTTTAFQLNNGEKVNDMVSAIQKDLSTKLGSITLSHSVLNTDGRFPSKASGFKYQADRHPNTKQPIETLLSADCKTAISEGVSDAVASCWTPPVSKCPSGPGSSMYQPQRVSVKKKGYCSAETISENTVPFSPDPSALRNILNNEGIKVRDPAGATPRVSTCPTGRGTSFYSAQRVPIRKPRTHTTASAGEPAGGTVTFSPDPSAIQSILSSEGVKQGDVMMPSACRSGRATSIYSAQRVPCKKTPSNASIAGAVSFSPDPSALRCILHNEGIKAGNCGATTPRVSVCPSQRATSIYTAQRVPMKKARAEEARIAGIGQTPIRTWTSQRVLASQSVKRNATHKTHLLDPSPECGETQNPSMTGSSQQDEEVVQRLFQEDTEHEQMKDDGDGVTPGQPRQHQQSHDGDKDSKKEKLRAAEPFIQEPHRQSVIVFSSARTLVGQNGAQTASIQTSQHAVHVSANQASSSQSGLNTETDRPVTLGKLCKTKASNHSSAMSALRRRLPPLEEMFLDEECALYTSRNLSLPNQPRCCNPVASALLFQDSTNFVPIIMTCPSLSPVPQLFLVK